VNETIQVLLHHGYIVLFLWVLADQIGIPLPASPVLIATGAVAGSGQLDLFVSIALATGASFLSNALWYEAGRYRGSSVLTALCRITFEPDVCVRKTKDTFTRHGAGSLLLSKFVPGLNAIAAPVAGVIRMPRNRFLLLNAIGAAVWASVFILLGYFLRSELERLLPMARNLGHWVIVILVAGAAGFVGFKTLMRWLPTRSLHGSRIFAAELRKRLDEGEDLMVVDLRPDLDRQFEPRTIPGSVRLDIDELEPALRQIPHNREIVLFCT
jgi:membrane protein DedA with SNARE-associated domain